MPNDLEPLLARIAIGDREAFDRLHDLTAAKLHGVTHRTLANRALAEGRTPDLPIENVMTDQVLYCFEDEEIEDVAANMGYNQVRRLPVLSRDKRLVGIVALGDLATKSSDESAEEALEGVSRPTR